MVKNCLNNQLIKSNKVKKFGSISWFGCDNKKRRYYLITKRIN